MASQWKEKARDWIRSKRGMLWPESEAESLTALLESVAEETAGNQATAVRLGQFIGDKLDEAKIRQQERQRAERIVEEVRADWDEDEEHSLGAFSACDEILHRLREKP
jgi:hypothetical protein